MRELGGLILLLVVTLSTLSGAGGAWGEDLSDSGICARCHETEAALAADTGGHAMFVDCLSCHADRRPGHFGRGHRRIPTSCTSHHDASTGPHPPPAHPPGTAKLRKNCLRCHEPHGSTNAHLVRTAIRTRGALRPIDFHDAGGLVSGGFADPEAPGRGLCEVCHRKTDFYLASGHGKPHFTVNCTACHDHAVGFLPVITDANCAICHPDEAGRLARPSRHHDIFQECSRCHAEVDPKPGPGHRAIPACADCHSPAEIATHAPPGIAAFPCAQCHDPHGSNNIELVREVIHTPQGADQPVQFTNREGRADGSFASASAPGTGVCEICHATTRFYPASGHGQPHLTGNCMACHDHAQGFHPLVTDASCPVCHPSEAARLSKPSQHHDNFMLCSSCHAEVNPEPGPGHRAIAACADCHAPTDIATHAPPGISAFACAQCHDPHGSDNIELVREVIHTPQGTDRPVQFVNRDGKADGSFASVSDPGTGVCEICHTTTQFYRADGTGAAHFDLPCFPCHAHERGFAPQ
jgi:predicted CXXCH cytochrome family protein